MWGICLWGGGRGWDEVWAPPPTPHTQGLGSQQLGLL